MGPGSRIVRVRRLSLGSWHVNHALDVVDAAGHIDRLVLRRWARPGWEVDAAAEALLDPYRLYYDRPRATPAPWMPATPVWSQAVAAVHREPPGTRKILIHRDYHPGNTLWSQGRLTGVVDWTQASWGPPELDLGHMRWNLVVDHGQPVPDEFLACYRATTGSPLNDQPYWDIVSLLDLLLDGDGPGDIGPDDLRRLEAYAQTLLTDST